MGNKRPRKNSYKKNGAFQRKNIIKGAAPAFKMIAWFSLVSGMSILFILAYNLLTQSDYFKIKNIKVTGGYSLYKGQIIKQAGLNPAANILSINLSLMRKRLLSDPSIAEAEIMRHLPDTLLIKIKTHMPLAVIDFGRKFIINKNGALFKEMDDSDPQDLPLITGLQVSDIGLDGAGPGIYYKSVVEVLKLGRETGSPVPLKAIEKIHIDKEAGIIVYTAKSDAAGLHKIKLGYNDYRNKYKNLKKVYLYLKKERDFLNFSSIDINNINRVVLTPAGNKKEV